jgi:deoxyribose-phosphate aldolase
MTTGEIEMILSKGQIAKMIEVSALRADCTEAEIDEMAAYAIEHGVGYVLAFPYFIPYLAEKVKGHPEVKVVGVIGFPAGGNSTATKVQEAKELATAGCAELDMVINVGLMKSGRYDDALADVRAVVAAANGLPLKVIIEAHYLNRAEIQRACEICLEAKATFVKTGTGWTPTGATLENIALIKSIVGDRIKIKASGGVRGLETLAEMYRRGATRFGIGLRTVTKIFDELNEYKNGYELR